MQPDEDKYGFIMNPQQAPKASPFSGLGKKQLIVLGVAAVVVLGIVGGVIYSAANSGPSNKEQLLAVAQQQNEIIRISDIALKEAKGIPARNLATTAKLSLRSDQSSLIAALKAQNVKVGAPQLKAGQDKTNDAKLTEGTQNNRFDEAYMTLVQSALVKYQRSLDAVYKTTVSVSLRATLKAQYQHASLIIGANPET
jgi:hypothetical protein